MTLIYNPPYLDELEHSVLNHTGIPGVGGGGGVPNSYLQITTSLPAGVSLVDSTPSTVTFNGAAAGGLFYVTRGTDISWTAGTVININTTGVYDIHIAAGTTPGTNLAQVKTSLLVNGLAATQDALFPNVSISDPADGVPVSCSTTVLGRSLTAGNTVGANVTQSGNAANDTVLTVVQISVTRRV